MKNIVRLIVIAVTLMGLGVVVEAQQPKKIFRIALLTGAAAPPPSSPSPFDQGLLNWATWKVKTSPLSAGMRMDRWTAFPNSRPNSRISL